MVLYVHLRVKSRNSYFRSKEHMESAKRTYEILNSELHDELPALHDSRLLFTVTNMQTLFAAEEVFHTETAKVSRRSEMRSKERLMFHPNSEFQVYSELEAIVDKLAKEVQKGTMPRKVLPKPQPLSSPLSSSMSNSMSTAPKGELKCHFYRCCSKLRKLWYDIYGDAFAPSPP